MRSIDLDLVRKKVGSFTIGKKRFDVYEPTIGQILQQAAESKLFAEEIAKIPDNDIQALTIKRHEWLIREVQIFLEGFDEETAKHLTHDQRNAIISLIYGMEIETEKKMEKPPAKKKKK